MRYRTEMLDNGVVVRNVDTDLIIAWVKEYWQPEYQEPEAEPRGPLLFCYSDITDGAGQVIAHDLYRGKAPDLVGSYEEDMGYPHFKGFEKAPRRDRVEHLLGTMVADFVCQFLQMLLEGANAGVTPNTKKKFCDMLSDLLRYWDVSHFGSWNSERRLYEPYFADPEPENPRLNFAGAARTYGLIELRKRFPQESEQTFKKLLCWAIDMMDGALKATWPEPSEDLQRLIDEVAESLSTMKRQAEPAAA